MKKEKKKKSQRLTVAKHHRFTLIIMSSCYLLELKIDGNGVNLLRKRDFRNVQKEYR